MTDVDGDEGFLADSETIIAAAVTVVEPHLGDASSGRRSTRPR